MLKSEDGSRKRTNNSKPVGKKKAKSTRKKPSEIDPQVFKLFLESLEESDQGDNFPSKIKSKLWVYANNGNISYPPSTVRNGKWCLFVNNKDHDEWWGKIRNRFLNGRLGDQIKTSTGIRLSKKPYKNKAVIIVYTYDYEDKEDVMRIRNELREIGVTWKISYKSDKSTNAGKYYSKCGDRVSIYYE
jgi:hypothetical protein